MTEVLHRNFFHKILYKIFLDIFLHIYEHVRNILAKH
jgi:hypothetical protein